MQERSRDWWFGRLKDVSRSFFLTLRILPGGVRRQIGYAYLLARTSDTIADTALLPLTERLHALDQFADRLKSPAVASLDFRRFLSVQEDSAERGLLADAEQFLGVLATFDREDQTLIRQVLEVIISGQRLDLERFADAGSQQIVALETRKDLDDYTYRVAGCVGEFWTRMCCRHLFGERVDPQELLSCGVRFGQGLQLVNVLRDIPADLAQGRCYVPREMLQRSGLVPADLRRPVSMPAFRAVYGVLLDQAANCLADGWRYTCLLPRRQIRVRLACAWPVLIGQQTLAKLRSANVLDADQRVKITRAEVQRLLLRSVALYPWRRRWEQLGRSSD